MQPQVRYARSGDVYIAYQDFGSGPADLILVPGFLSHLDLYWSEPRIARWLTRLGSHCRVIQFDKRGTGLSDRPGDMPDLETRMEDVRAVADAAGAECPALFGISEGGTMAALYAATYPTRCQSLVLFGAFARFSSWMADDAALEAFFDYARTEWGTGAIVDRVAPTMKGDPGMREFISRYERLGASPSAAMQLMRVNSQIDVRGVLSSIRVPTLIMHRTGDTNVSVEGSRELAAEIPDAELVELPGVQHTPFLGDDAEQIADRIGEFVTGRKAIEHSDSVLATIVFTDIVGSTRQAQAMGDRQWQDLLETHNSIFRQELARFQGREVRSTGDGFVSSFDGPARAVRFSKSLIQALNNLDLEIRVGIHTGEVSFAGAEVHGIAVNVAARVMDLAADGQVLVSRTVRDLIAGSGIELEYAGEHALKGLSDAWQVYSAA